MPDILHSLAQRIADAQEKKGVPKKKAQSAGWAIGTSALQKYGYLKKGSQQLTKKGKNYKIKKVEKI